LWIGAIKWLPLVQKHQPLSSPIGVVIPCCLTVRTAL
jgi:hypothetical protein